MLIYYTEHEGGVWIPQEILGDKWRLIEELRGHRTEGRSPGTFFRVNSWPVAAHSVLFEDGDIWDSHFGYVRENKGPNYIKEIQSHLYSKRDFIRPHLPPTLVLNNRAHR